MKNKLLHILFYIRQHENWCVFVLGGLSALTFAPRFWLWFAVAAFAYLMYLSVNTSNKKDLFRIGYVFGFAHFAVGFSWIGNALLIDAVKFGWLYPITLLASGAFFGLFFAFPVLLTYWGKTKWQKWIVFSAGFVLFEWIRSFILTGFPWNLAGYSLAFSDELIQTASVGGTYLLSLIAVMSYSVWGIVNKKTLLPAIVIVGGIYACLYGGGYYRINSFDIKESDTLVRLVQPSIPQTMKWNKESREQNFIEYINLSSKPGVKVPDLIVWGETASPFVLDRDEVHLNMLKPLLTKGSYLVTGMITYGQRKDRYVPYNSMVVFDNAANPVGYYHKSHLVPFGEYIPLREYLPEFIKPVANAIGEFGKGNGPSVMKFDRVPSFGGIICYEAIFPDKIVDKKNKPQILINVTNDGWYGNSAGPYQHWVATKLRAVESGIEIIRVANNGISGVINFLGIEKKSLALNEKNFIDVYIDKNSSINTLYNKKGNLLIVIFCLILLFFGFISVGHKG